MFEVDNSGSEIFPTDEKVRGGKQHKRIVGGAMLAPVLSVAAAGLVTLAILESGTIRTPVGDLPGPPVQQILQPVDPPEEPRLPEEPEPKKPEPKKPEPKKPEPKKPEPKKPEPKKPEPKKPEPKKPEPVTPPPTTPPPTTPPPLYYPPDEPEEPEEPEPTPFIEPTMTMEAWYEEFSDGVMVFFSYTLDTGSASTVTVSPVLSLPTGETVTECPGFPRTTGSGTETGGFFASTEDWGGSNPPRITLYGTYDGQTVPMAEYEFPW